MTPLTLSSLPPEVREVVEAAIAGKDSGAVLRAFQAELDRERDKRLAAESEHTRYVSTLDGGD